MGKDLKGKELGKGISQRADGRYIARFTSKTGKRKTLYDFKLNELKRKREKYRKRRKPYHYRNRSRRHRKPYGRRHLRGVQGHGQYGNPP
jgi:hypothetical protein